MTSYQTVMRRAVRDDWRAAVILAAARLAGVLSLLAVVFWLAATGVRAAAFARANPDLLHDQSAEPGPP